MKMASKLVTKMENTSYILCYDTHEIKMASKLVTKWKIRSIYYVCVILKWRNVGDQ